MLKAVQLRIIAFLFVDFVSLIGLFLFFTYYGMCHLLLIFLGILILLLGMYDIKTGNLSLLILDIFRLPVGAPDRGGVANLIPFGLALLIIGRGVSQLFEHGIINSGQGEIMSGFIFIQFAIWLVGISAFVMVAAIGSQLRYGD